MNKETEDILALPNGARFFRCALQVNPNDYAVYRGQEPDPDATDYAQRLIDEAVKNDIKILAITQHNNCDFVEIIRPLAQKAGVVIFPGFEMKSHEGVHLLCIYDPETDHAKMQRYLGQLDIHDVSSTDAASQKSFKEILRLVQDEQSGMVIAAHGTNAGGLFRVLSGQACINAWKNHRLLAIQIPGAIDGLPQDVKPIVKNTNPDYHRDIPRGVHQAIAVVNAKDVVKPEDLADKAAWSWIKMAEFSIEGLKQAFLDPDSRIRLNSEEDPVPHVCLEAIEWEGGFLDGVRIHLNENLNVLIGGRGAGKSTVVESIRHAFAMLPATDEATKSYRGIVKDVIRQNTTIRVLVSSPKLSHRKYWIVRNGSNPPDVRDADTGEVLSLEPGFVVGDLEVYGQHELSELSRQEEKQRRLLERFASDSDVSQKQKRELRRKLQESREKIHRLLTEMNRFQERLAEKPKLEETLKRYQVLGIEEKLKARSALIKEERVLKTAADRINPLDEALIGLHDAIPDIAFLSDAALGDMAGKGILTQLRKPIESVREFLAGTIDGLAELKERVLKEIAGIDSVWHTDREKPVLDEYRAILKTLNKESVDGDEFISLQKQLEDLKPLKDQHGQMEKNLAALRRERTTLLAEWEDVKMKDRREWEAVAKRVSKKLAGSVQVMMGDENRASLEVLLREHVEGSYSKSLQNLLSEGQLSARSLAESIRKGTAHLRASYGCLTDQAAERLAAAGESLAMRVEEEDWLQMPTIHLNLGTEERPQFVPLKRLSTGQKATALLCLLLLESDAPLVIDQPEDDLDNRFISEYIVPKMKQEKRRRQFLFASHNANIPVLGDAELIVGLTPESDELTGELAGVLKPEHRGAIDNEPVRKLVEEILEGGRDAFYIRRNKYGF